MNAEDRAKYQAQYDKIVQKNRETRAAGFENSPDKEKDMLEPCQLDGPAGSADVEIQPFYAPNGVSYLVTLMMWCSLWEF